MARSQASVRWCGSMTFKTVTVRLGGQLEERIGLNLVIYGAAEGKTWRAARFGRGTSPSDRLSCVQSTSFESLQSGENQNHLNCSDGGRYVPLSVMSSKRPIDSTSFRQTSIPYATGDAGHESIPIDKPYCNLRSLDPDSHRQFACACHSSEEGGGQLTASVGGPSHDSLRISALASMSIQQIFSWSRGPAKVALAIPSPQRSLASQKKKGVPLDASCCRLGSVGIPTGFSSLDWVTNRLHFVDRNA